MRLLRKRNGTIFIDVMLGIYILAIVGFMFAATLATAAVSRSMADERTKATTIVNRQLESIKNVGYGNLTYSSLVFYGLISSSTTTSPYSFSNVGSSNNRVSNMLPGGTGTVTISDVNPVLRDRKSVV